jgi:hypothetical protein
MPATPLTTQFKPVPLDGSAAPEAVETTDWLWHGYIARGNLTLLTSRWKAGKTTLLAGLLRQCAAGGTFLDRAAAPARALVVSEESRATWRDRLERLPIGAHAELLSRPFPRRPTPAQWGELVEYALARRAAGELDLFVVDPLAKFLPGATESDLGALFEFLDPLQRLAGAGAGVLILHHPRKARSEEGSTARGSGGLLAAVDVIVELSAFGTLRSDERRRQLFAVSRSPATPRRLVYEWDPATGEFTGLGDPLGQRFAENWETVRGILAGRKRAATHHELLHDWPEGQERPSPGLFYRWLNRAHEEQRVRREGTGSRVDPYRYRLPNEDDEYYDRGELPPLKPLFGEVEVKPRRRK